MDISIIIVNYNTLQMTQECIDSIFEKTEGVEFEVVLVDNASTDGSKDHFEHDGRIKYIYSEDNLGFGRANNLGAQSALGKYLLLLNSDTLFVENILKVFFEFMENHQTYAACGCNLVDKDYREVASHGCLPSLKMELLNNLFNRLCLSYYKNKLSIGQTIKYGNLNDTGYLAGADIFIRSDVFEIMKGFDPLIFMYFEETDLFARMKKAGMKCCVIPDHKIIHLVGGSFGVKREKQLQRAKWYEKSKIYYYRKNHGVKYAFCVKIATIFSILISRRIGKFDMIKVIVNA